MLKFAKYVGGSVCLYILDIYLSREFDLTNHLLVLLTCFNIGSIYLY
jgi:hypothetical protein